jgi:hypothetical protein
MRYLRLLAGSATLSFVLVWAWVALMPMAFMDAEYPSWRAKMLLLDHCDLGETVILGDSRAATDILPRRLPIHATNLAVGGGETIEAYVAMARALACPDPPKRVLISFVPSHFTHADLFWERSVRYGFFDRADIAALREASRQTGDNAIYQAGHTDGLPAVIRDWSHLTHFPSLYFASLAHGGGFLRWSRNQQILNETMTEGGHYYFGKEAGSDTVAIEGHMTGFQPLPILDHYFDRVLTLLDAHGIEAEFVAMPVNEATWRQVRPDVREQFIAYLTSYADRYPRFHVSRDIMPHWPNRLFGDQFCHLNPEGAELFSAQLAQRLQDAPPKTQNEAQNGWLSDTGTEASAKVVPISKRGS